MTRNLDSLVDPAVGPDEPDRSATSTTQRRRPARQWWQRPWVIPLASVVLAFLIYVWQPYLGFDPAKARVPLNPNVPEQYGLLVSHIIFGTIALSTLCLQLWPWLRREHPAVHRWVGRLYVFGGALPCALLIALLIPAAGTPIGAVGQATAGFGWILTTVMGYIRARQRRRYDHRRWMLYSFAFAMNIVWGRLAFILLQLAHVDSAAVLIQVGEASTWLGWVVNLLLVRWWLDRRVSGRVSRAI